MRNNRGRPANPSPGYHRHRGLDRWHNPLRKHRENWHTTEEIFDFSPPKKIPQNTELISIIKGMEYDIITGEILKEIEKLIGLILHNKLDESIPTMPTMQIPESERNVNPHGMP